jgi:hypothetical protein
MVSRRRVSLQRPPVVDRLAFFGFVVFFLILAFLGIDHSCLDAADSAYLASSDAIARGMVPYQDFLLAHPPLLFLLGAPLAKIGMGVLPFRIFSILVSAGLGLAIWRLAYKLTANTGIAMLAGVLALFAPLGLFFSKEFINDPLLALLTVVILLLLFSRSKRALAAAGALSILATLTKLTWAPMLVVCIAYVILFRRKTAWIYLTVALGGSIAAAVIVHLLTGGAYLNDILGAQASKALSLSNFTDGLERIWRIDWPLIIPAAAGTWFAARAIMRRQQMSPGLKGRLFLVAGWFLSGLALLFTLPLEGHDTNLFLLAEPVFAVLGAWGIMGLAERRTLLAIAVVSAWVVVAVPVLVDRDRDFLNRSNAADVSVIVAEIRDRSAEDQASLVPGCYAVESERPVTHDFFDQFLWEEKYKRGDDDAVAVFADIGNELVEEKPPAVVFSGEQYTKDLLSDQLESHYRLDFTGASEPPTELWLPKN